MKILRLLMTLPILLAFVSAATDRDAELETRQWLLVADTSGSYPVWTIIDIDQQADLDSLISFSRDNGEYSVLLHEIWEALNLRIEGGIQMSIPVAMRFTAPSSTQIFAQAKIPFGPEEIPQLFSKLQGCLREGPEVRLSLTLGAWSLLRHGGNSYIPMEEWGEPRPLDLPEYGGYWRWPATVALTEGDTKDSSEFILHLASTVADRLDIQPDPQHDVKLEPLLEAILRKMDHQNPRVQRTSFGGVLIQSSPPVRAEPIDPEDRVRWEFGFGEGYDYDLGGVLSTYYYVTVGLQKEKERDGIE